MILIRSFCAGNSTNIKREFRKKGYFPKEKLSNTWKKMKDFNKVKIPKALRNITHSIEMGFILKSLYKPKALAIKIQLTRFVKMNVKVDGVNRSFSKLLTLVATIIDVSKKTSAIILILTRKEDSLSIVWFLAKLH